MSALGLLCAWGALLGVAVYVLGGAVLDALADWWWLRGQQAAMEAHRRRMASLGRRCRR